eukprot:CAMPEP_0203977678 /NCGR_PEP_ID=MMETSP0359-20131031/101734_1 /ASSEMBLY_ACC=CAM_ASM_000338 /TAXON_ID=268821 /ORGANISM="Scrippsiella Hangoei, Strain SHTV-5" /LENGTH=466 /DNA_ID=CAMNT_0050915887 /DNA_START=28 /DNA_END=1425 /DNA_ORIENTATION=-
MAVTTEAQDRACRICLCGEEEEQLVRPCACRGTIEWVHGSCLQEWLENRQTESLRCELCLGKFVVKGRGFIRGFICAALAGVRTLVGRQDGFVCVLLYAVGVCGLVLCGLLVVLGVVMISAHFGLPSQVVDEVLPVLLHGAHIVVAGIMVCLSFGALYLRLKWSWQQWQAEDPIMPPSTRGRCRVVALLFHAMVLLVWFQAVTGGLNHSSQPLGRGREVCRLLLPTILWIYAALVAYIVPCTPFPREQFLGIMNDGVGDVVAGGAEGFSFFRPCHARLELALHLLWMLVICEAFVFASTLETHLLADLPLAFACPCVPWVDAFWCLASGMTLFVTCCLRRPDLCLRAGSVAMQLFRLAARFIQYTASVVHPPASLAAQMMTHSLYSSLALVIASLQFVDIVRMLQLVKSKPRDMDKELEACAHQARICSSALGCVMSAHMLQIARGMSAAWRREARDIEPFEPSFW